MKGIPGISELGISDKEFMDQLIHHMSRVFIKKIELIHDGPNLVIVERVTNDPEIERSKKAKRVDTFLFAKDILASMYMRRIVSCQVESEFFDVPKKVPELTKMNIQEEYFDMLNELCSSNEKEVIDFKLVDGNGMVLYYAIFHDGIDLMPLEGREARVITALNILFDSKRKILSFYSFNISKENGKYKSLNNMIVGPMFFGKKEREVDNYIRELGILENGGVISDEMMKMFIDGIERFGDHIETVKSNDYSDIVKLAECDYSNFEMYVFKKMMETVSDHYKGDIKEKFARGVYHTAVKTKESMEMITPEQLNFFQHHREFVVPDVALEQDFSQYPLVAFSERDMKWMANWLLNDMGLDPNLEEVKSTDLSHVFVADEVQAYKTLVFNVLDGIGTLDVDDLREVEDHFSSDEFRFKDNKFKLHNGEEKQIVVTFDYSFRDDALDVFMIHRVNEDMVVYKIISMINLKNTTISYDNIYSIDNVLYINGRFENIPPNDEEFDNLFPYLFMYKNSMVNFLWKYLAILMLQYYKPERNRVVRETKPVEHKPNNQKKGNNVQKQDYVVKRILMTAPSAKKYIKEKVAELGEAAERIYTIEEWKRRGHWRVYHKGEANEKKIWIEEVDCHRHKEITKREVRLKL